MDLSNENIIHVKGKKSEYIQFRKLLKYSDKISHAYVIGLNQNFRTAKSKTDKISKEEYDNSINCYKNICEEIGLKFENIIKPFQCHTNNVKIVESKQSVDGPDFYSFQNTDGLITNKKEIVLSTTNADCILFFLYDPVKNVVANVHSGWRGTLQRISINAIRKMKENYGCDAKDIICCICPSIRKCHFEVDKDVYDLFCDGFKDLENLNDYIEKRESKWNIDTVFINKELLKREGLKEENIIDSKLCSVCNKDIIHSYRAEGNKFGLLTAIIGLK